MKPYGVAVIADPDVADIKHDARKGCVGKFAGKSGDYHPYSRGGSKARIRRYWKRRARKIGRDECRDTENTMKVED